MSFLSICKRMLCLINWCLKHSFTARLKGRSKLVHPNSARIIRIRFAASDVGRYENTLELVFIEFESRNTFLITRKVFGTIGDPELHDRLRPEHPYTRRRGPSMNLTGKIVPGLRPPQWTKTHWNEKLPKYDVPPYVIEAAFGRRAGNAAQNIRRLMPRTLNVQTYGDWFTYLLYIEEEQMRYEYPLLHIHICKSVHHILIGRTSRLMR